MKYPVLLMETAQKLAQQDEKEEKGSLLTDKDKRKLARYMQKLGFEDVGTSFCGLHAGSKERVGNVFCTLPFTSKLKNVLSVFDFFTLFKGHYAATCNIFLGLPWFALGHRVVTLLFFGPNY